MLNKLLKAIHFIEDSIIVLLVLAMVTLSCSSLILRNLEMAGLTWGEDAVRICVLWVALFGALRASREQSHIAIDLITHYTTPLVQRVIHFLVSIASATVSSIACYYSFLFVLSEKEDGITAFLNIPSWAFEAVIPFSFGVIALRFIIHSLHPPKPHELTV